MDNPRYVVVATLVAPHGLPETYGRSTAAWNAAPAVARVIQRIGPQLGVIPDMNKDIDVSELLPLLWKSPAEKAAAGQRSEEHTSELQSLMRISYAVFCLKKKKKI